MKRVFITGMGAITPNAVGVEEFTTALKNGVNGIGQTTLFDTTNYTARISGEVKNFNPELYVNKKDAKRHDRYTVYALAAARMAAEQAKLTEKNFDPDRTGVIVSTGIGGITFFEQEHQTYLSSGPSRVSPFLVPMMICNIASGCIAMEYGMNGPNFCIVSACASSLHAIGESYLKIAHGECDIMMCGGSEAALTPLTTAGFAKMKALSTRNDEPEKASRAFDRDRDGFVMGEGAGIIVLESEESALKRGSTILAEVKGYGASADAHHLTAPHPEGVGAAKAVKRAIELNNFPIENIDYINAHGTSTPLGDIAEMKALKLVFGEEGVKKPIVNATKSMIGHLLGAAGGVGTIATVIQMQNGFIHPNRNLENIDPELTGFNFAPNHFIEKQINAALVDAFGFGGQNACLLITKA